MSFDMGVCLWVVSGAGVARLTTPGLALCYFVTDELQNYCRKLLYTDVQVYLYSKIIKIIKIFNALKLNIIIFKTYKIGPKCINRLKDSF